MTPKNLDAHAPAGMDKSGFFGFPPIIWAWALYDLANTVFSALFVTVNFPIWIKNFAGGTTELVGRTTSISCLLSAICVPLVGSLSDRMNRRMPFIICLTTVCCVATPIMAFLPLNGALLAGGLAFFAYYTGLALYDSILPSIATPEIQGRASGLGIGLGYGGTLVALAAALLIGLFLPSENGESIKGINFAIGALYLIFAAPLFIMLREPGSKEPLKLGETLAGALGRVARGAREASRDLWTYIVAFFCFANAAMAVIVFFGLYATNTLKLSQNTFYIIYAVLAIAAGLGSVAAGRAVDRIGPRKVLFFDGFLWIGVLIFMLAVPTVTGLVVGGIAGGAALGTLWTANRPMLIRLANPERIGETFGFLGMASSSSSVIGPYAYGWLETRFGDYRYGLVALIGFFITGLVLLCFVPSEGHPGHAAAKA